MKVWFWLSSYLLAGLEIAWKDEMKLSASAAMRSENWGGVLVVSL